MYDTGENYSLKDYTLKNILKPTKEKFKKTLKYFIPLLVLSFIYMLLISKLEYGIIDFVLVLILLFIISYLGAEDSYLKYKKEFDKKSKLKKK